MWKRITIMFGCFILIAGGIGYYKYLQISAAIAQHAHMEMPPIAVATTLAKTETWPRTIQAVGSFSPVRGVMISTEEAGKITALHIESGSHVKKDDLLVQQDVSVEQANLDSVLARIELARSTLDRVKKMMGSGAVSQADLDDANSKLKQAEADAESLRATIARKTIRAPFDGVTGIRQVQLGQYLSPGTPIVTLQTLDPIYFDFKVPQQEIKDLGKGQKVDLAVDAFTGETFQGTISTINPVIDTDTRMVQVQAFVENDSERLKPGMFAKASVELGKQDSFVTLPATAIVSAPYGDSVYVVEKMQSPDTHKEYLGAKQVFVRVGTTHGDVVSILEGVTDGEEVVTLGGFKLRPGVPVLINNTVQPEAEYSPKTTDN